MGIGECSSIVDVFILITNPVFATTAVIYFRNVDYC